MAPESAKRGVASREDKAAREQKALRELESHLIEKYRERRSPEDVTAAMRAAQQRFAESKVRDFVPVLVDRVVRRHLDSGVAETASGSDASAAAKTVVMAGATVGAGSPDVVATERIAAPEFAGDNSTTARLTADRIGGSEDETVRIGTAGAAAESGAPAAGAADKLRSLTANRRGLLTLAGAGVVVAGAAWAFTRPDGSATPATPPGAGASALTRIKGVVGTEKLAFFEDSRVADIFAAHGFEVQVQGAGSREIATSVDLGTMAFAFPSSLPAAEKIKREAGARSHITPFYSPMAIATFAPIVDLLDKARVLEHDGPAPRLDFAAYLDLVQRGVQWDELEGNTTYPVAKNILISTTDVRTSNSAAMYLAVASYVVNEDAVVRGATAEQHVLPTLQRLFLAQGFTEDSSAGPFEEYLTTGMGATPMTWIYEAQYVAAAVADRLKSEMVLLYPSPTVVSRHTLVPLKPEGEHIGELLHGDPKLQNLAAEFGFRTGDPTRFNEVVSEHKVPVSAELIDVVDVPAYETLERLIDGVAGAY